MPQTDDTGTPKTYAAEDHLLDLSNTVSCVIGRTKTELKALSQSMDKFLDGQPLTQKAFVELGDYLGCISENSILQEPHAAFRDLAAEIKARACQVDELPGNAGMIRMVTTTATTATVAVRIQWASWKPSRKRWPRTPAAGMWG